jgi:3-isopropylmalate/(R)-2-methylmalate dehydratase large subunit
MGMTLCEKILAAKSCKNRVSPGEIVEVEVDLAVAHEACARVAKTFREIGAPKVWDTDKIVVLFDHWVPPPTEEAATLHKSTREFVKKYNITKFFDIGRHGVCHQLIAEKGFVSPGALVVGADSHTPTLGALGAFAMGIGTTDMASVFALGRTWFQIPENMLIEVNGSLKNMVCAKDVILKLLGLLGASGAMRHAIEFRGTTIENMDMDERLTLTNMVVEMGAETGIIPPDSKTYNYLEACQMQNISSGRTEGTQLSADEDAVYQKTYSIEVDDLEPQVACPPRVDNVKPVTEVADNHKVKIDQAFLGSCTNGRLTDLRAAARLLEGERIHKNVRYIISPATQYIYKRALEEGLIQIFIDAECTVSAPGCGPCFGGHGGVLSPNEICISASNRNFVGRMGSANAQVYLASPATVTASAITGYITNPQDV